MQYSGGRANLDHRGFFSVIADMELIIIYITCLTATGCELASLVDEWGTKIGNSGKIRRQLIAYK